MSQMRECLAKNVKSLPFSQEVRTTLSMDIAIGE